MNLKTIRLEQCCECITDGDHLPPPKADSGIPFITISNVDAYNQIDFSNSMYVPEQYYDALKSIRKVQKNDILYSVVGSFGVPVLIKDDKKFCFQRHIALLRPNDKIDCRFLYYVMKSPSFYAQADTVALGAAQRTISLSSLRSMTIQIPEIDVQRRIADILSAYDDLIENDRKQIKLLEEAAQRLYKEWFVDLRFPGWETTPIVDGLPEGWEQYKFSDVVDIMSGGTPKTENKGYYNGTIPFYTPKDSDGSVFAFLTQKTLTEEGLNSCNSPLFPQNTIIITARGTVGKTTILARPMAMNQSCYALKSDVIGSFDIVGKTDFELFPADIAKQLRKNDIALLDSNKPMADFSETIYQKDDEPCSCLVTKYVLRDAAGASVGIYGVSHDVVKEHSTLE